MRKLETKEIFKNITTTYTSAKISTWPGAEALEVVIEGVPLDSCNISVAGYNTTNNVAFPLALIKDSDLKKYTAITSPGSYKADISGCYYFEIIVSSVTSSNGISCYVTQMGE